MIAISACRGYLSMIDQLLLAAAVWAWCMLCDMRLWQGLSETSRNEAVSRQQASVDV
jgi:hypothetical protein